MGEGRKSHARVWTTITAALTVLASVTTATPSEAQLRALGAPEAGRNWVLEVPANGASRLGLLLVTSADGDGVDPLFVRFVALPSGEEGMPNAVRVAVPIPSLPVLEGTRLTASLLPISGTPASRSKPVSGVVRGDGSPDGFGIRACSLGCNGTRISLSCSATDIYENEVIRLRFSSAVDPSSLVSSALRVFDASTTAPVPGRLGLSPDDATVVLFEPSLSFNSAGSPVFGFQAGARYRVVVRGSALNPFGPFVRSADGLDNQTELDCTVVASKGVRDVRPGPPTAEVLVDVVTSYDPKTGAPLTIAPQHPAAGATNVLRGTDIVIRFDDLMDPSTLVDPITGTSPSIAVRVDPDGNTADPSDQFPVAGSFTVALDLSLKETTVGFDPDEDLPAAGSEVSPLRIVVELQGSPRDLAGNALANPGASVFVPEL